MKDESKRPLPGDALVRLVEERDELQSVIRKIIISTWKIHEELENISRLGREALGLKIEEKSDS